jgi:hypothetical protein
VFLQTGGSWTWVMNFGQRAFAYTAPSGFKALCTQNLPTPTIGATSTTQANDYFNVMTWAGNNVTPRTISGLDFQPDFVWLKDRTIAHNNYLYDAVRGAGNNSELSSNSTAVEGGSGASEYGYVSAFTSNGFTLTGGTDPTYYMADVNYPGSNFVAWQWKANGAGSSNTAGNITSTVSANNDSGFSIVTGTLGAAGVQNTVGHGCKVGGIATAPSMIIFKTRSGATYNWSIYHASVCDTTSKYFRFTTDALLTYSTVWGAALPTSTVFGVTGDGCGSPSNPFVAYCFAPVASYSAFGSYIGNGSSNGPFIYTGFRPRWILFKRSDAANSWFIYDTARDTFNAMFKYLQPDSAAAEAGTSGSNDIDITANGFKIRNSNNYDNASGGTIIYAAFAESPFKYALAR